MRKFYDIWVKVARKYLMLEKKVKALFGMKEGN